MNKIKAFWLLLVASIVLPVAAQQIPQLPMDSAVRYGKLPNGLTYYIRHNALPENRANFYIAQKVGSVQEEENQRGLAHFLEHMCFNGTDNFPDDHLVKYCETIGVKFGQNLNAYTAADETVYNIDDVPVTESNVDSCLLILHDWADGLTLDPKEIDKERGVIHEEWRMRSSASGRILERNLANLYPGSRYGHRYPIGLMSVVDNFKPEELRAYYEKWYRPDLQGIIVVGDIDVDKVEAKIKSMFSSIKMPENPAAYELYPVPSTTEPIYIVDKDKEQTRGIVQIFFKHEPIPSEMRNTVAYLSMQYFFQTCSSALNARLSELSKKADCPFIAASCNYETYIMSKTMDAFSFGVLPKPGKDAEALQSVMEEVERASKYGFNASEVIRAREEFLSYIEKIYNNRDKQENSYYVPQYVRNFLENDPIPDIETEYKTYKLIAQSAPVEYVSAFFKELVASTDTDFVVLGMYPDKEGVAVPTADQFKQAVAAAKSAKLEAYVDNVKNEPLVAKLPKKGKITKESKADFGYTCWTLSNGARVYFKKTDFDDSEVSFQATSFGGKSRIADKDRVNMELLEDVMQSTGLGNFNSTELEKALSGKQVSCAPSLSQTSEYLNGSSTPKDLRTLFELIYLRFQTPANDVEGYNNLMAAYRVQLENIEKNPQAAFSDSIKATIYDHNPRFKRIHLADLDQASYSEIRRIYSERFNAAGDFDFVFTGAFNVDSLRAFTEQYIAPLKAVKTRETYDASKVFSVSEGSRTNNFRRVMETPQAGIFQLWSGSTPYTMKSAIAANALGEILTQRYLKSIREDAGIAYSVSAAAQCAYGAKESFQLQVYCPVKPAKLDSALLLMKQDLENVANKGVTDEELNKVVTFELKDYADSQKKNSYWEELLINKIRWNKDEQTGYEAVLKALRPADVQNFCKDVVLKQHNCCIVSMLPADFTEQDGAK